MESRKTIVVLLMLFLLTNHNANGQSILTSDQITQYSYSVIKLCSSLLADQAGENRLIFTVDKDIEIQFTASVDDQEQNFIFNDFVPFYEKNTDLVCKTNGILFKNLVLDNTNNDGQEDGEGMIRFPELKVKLPDSTINIQDFSKFAPLSLKEKTFTCMKEGSILIQRFQITDPDYNKITFIKGKLKAKYIDKGLEIEYSEGFVLEVNDENYQFKNGDWVGTDNHIPGNKSEDDRKVVYQEVFNPWKYKSKEVKLDVGNGMLNFIYGSIVAPKEVRKKKRFKGIVVIGFDIDVNGRIKNAKIVSDPGYGCGQEVLRVVKLMDGMFIPAKNKNGLPMNLSFNLPIMIRMAKK